MRNRYKHAYFFMNTCDKCRHWRDKAWDGDNGIGICDNPKVKIEVNCKGFLELLNIDPRDQKQILHSIRFPNDFGCIFFESINP